jgi:hypothetical protein
MSSKHAIEEYFHMPENTNGSKLNIEKVRAIANQKLQYNAQITPDDPVLAVLALNGALFDEYLEALNLALLDAQAKQDSATKKYMEEVKRSFDYKLETAAGYLKSEVEQVVEAGENSIQNIAQYEKSLIQELTQLNFIGSACWFLSGAVMTGTILLKWLGFFG